MSRVNLSASSGYGSKGMPKFNARMTGNKRLLVSIGPVGQVAYLGQEYCNSSNYKKVCLIAQPGQRRKFFFNHLLLASVSKMLGNVIAEHFASPQYSHGECIYISTGLVIKGDHFW